MDHVRLQIQSTEPIDCSADARCIESIVVRCDGADGWVMEIVLQKGTVPDLRPGSFVVEHLDTMEFPLHTGGIYTITADEKVPQPAPPTDPKRPDVEEIKGQWIEIVNQKVTDTLSCCAGQDDVIKFAHEHALSLCDGYLSLVAELKVITEERDIFKSADYDALNSKADSLLAGLVEAVEALDEMYPRQNSRWRKLTAALTAAKQHLKGKEKKDDAEDGSKPAQG